MIARIFYSLSLFSSFAFADQSNPADLLNEALSHDYSFVERSLNQSDLRIEESAGEILFNTSKGFVVNIYLPLKSVMKSVKIRSQSLILSSISLEP